MRRPACRFPQSVFQDCAEHYPAIRFTGSDARQTPDKSIDHGTLRRLIGAGADVAAESVGTAGGWGVVINYGRARQTLR